MSMFHLFFGIEKKSFVRKKILLGVEKNSIDMYVGGKKSKNESYMVFPHFDLNVYKSIMENCTIQHE